MADGESSDTAPLVAPMAVWVRGGGTTSSAQDKADAEMRAATAARRAAEDRRFDIVRANPGAARMHAMQLGGKDSHASIVLALKHPKDNAVLDWITCELSEQPTDDGGREMILNLCCPRCVLRHGRPMGECQIKIHESNRKFWLDSRPKDQGGQAGELWVNPRDPNEVVTLAGTITTEGWISCPVCTWKFRIDQSVVHTA